MSLLSTNLPAGRRWAMVGDFFEVTRKPKGTRLPEGGSVPFVPMEAIPQGENFEPRYDVRPVAQLSSGTYFERGDLLISKITPSFENGKQAITNDLPAAFGYATTEVIPLRPRTPGQDKRLLFFYLLHPEIRSFVADRMEGSTGRQRVPETVLLELPYPELQPNDQSAIADALERTFHAAKVELRNEIATGELKRNAKRALFAHGLRREPQKETSIGLIPNSWDVSECERVAEDITVGVVVRPASHYVASGVPAFRSLNVREDRLDTSNLVYFSTTVNDTLLRKSKLREGDVLVVRTGYPGTSCVVPPQFVGANCIDLVIVRPKKDKIDSGFLSRFLNSESGKSQALSAKHGLAQQHLNVGALRRVNVPVPKSLEEQRDIVSILEAIDSKVDLHKQKRALLERLFKTLLHKLVTGEIGVDQLDLSALKVA
jgi:type I restriction enzyme, S subunit